MGKSDLTIASTATGGVGEEIRTASRPVLRVAAGVGQFLGAHAVPLTALVVVLGTASVVAAWRRHLGCLRDREARTLLPTDSFDPKLEEVARFWGGPLSQTRRRREWTRRRAEAIRFCLSADTEVEGGLVTHSLEASRRALALLEPNAPHQVELERPEPTAEGVTIDSEVPVGGESRRSRRSPLGGTSPLRGRRPAPAGAGVAGAGPVRLVRARAELTIAPGQTHSLAQLTLNPDPLTPLAGALADLAAGEAGYVALDLQPLSGGQLKAARRRARRRDHTRPDWTRQLTSGAIFNDDPLAKSSPKSTASTSPVGALKRIESREETMTDYDRFASGEPVFSAQLLIWAEAASKTRARAIVEGLVTGFAPMNQRAHWRRTGFHLGPIHLGGADSASRRWSFDHRAATGCHHPSKPSIVGASEIAGLIKPPSIHCHVSKVLRGGGLVPPPPSGLPTWESGAEGLMPVGEVTERGVKRWVGVYLKDTFFTAMFGKSRFGKTNAAIVAMVALARLRGVPGGQASEWRPGFAFLDPHGDGIDDLKRYLIADADRVQIMDLRRRKDARQAGWNPLSMVGRDADEIEDTVSMMVAGFSAVLGWSEVNNRAQNLLTQAVASLCQLNMQLPPHLQATMFQIPTILTDEAWRDEILRFLPAHLADFWTTKLKTQTDAKTATSPVTNLCDRLRASNQMAALFGQSVSTFDMRRIMDDGTLLLLCPGGAGDKERMAHVLILFEMFRAATSRHDLDPADRRRFDAFLDEMQVADQGSGSDYITRMFREAAKFGLRIHAMAQQPDALSAQTLAAIADNRSHLSSTTVGHRSATWLSQEFGKDVEPSTMTRIRAWHRIASVSLHGVPSKPFRVRNLSLLEAHGAPGTAEEVAALEATVDRNMGRLSVTEVLDHLETLDSDILAHLRPGSTPRPPRPGQGAPGGATARRRRAPVEVPAERPIVPPAELPAGVASIANRRRGRGDWNAE